MAGDKVIAVVGVGPALGAEIARRFVREGFAAGLVARRAQSVEPVAAQLMEEGGRALAVTANAGDPASLRAGLEQIAGRLGPPEVLVHNASGFAIGGILDLRPEQFEEAWRVSVLGAVVAVQTVLPAMLQAGRGTILLTGATAALRGGARFAAFASAKAALRSLGQSLARELGPKGIHVAHVVIDGQIDTPAMRQQQPDRELHTLLSPAAIADTYWHLHAQHPTSWTQELDLRPAVEPF